jgi:Asp-tRNA(Asn)/Glu-tRNA(Gln) amidotransferase A subunit family amidase
MQSAQGLPIGIQVIGRLGADDLLLSLAAMLEQMTSGARAPAVFVA